jgi:hypothetical protein
MDQFHARSTNEQKPYRHWIGILSIGNSFSDFEAEA